MSQHIIYICGGRSFLANKLGRKIYSVVSIWRSMGFEVTHLCGGDITSLAKQKSSNSATYGAQNYHDNALRKSKYIQPVMNTLSEWRDMTHNIKLKKVVAQHAENHKPILVWERSSRLHDSGLEVARKNAVPYVLEWKDHLVPYQYSLFRKKALALEKFKMEQADFIVVESAVLKHQLAEEYSLTEDKFIVAHNAVDVHEFVSDEVHRAELRKSLAVDDKTVLVGYLGSYAFYHDTISLVKAARYFRDKNIKVLMVGAGKEYAIAHAEAVTSNVEDDKVIFNPPVQPEDVPKYLSAIDIAVLPGSTDIICPIKVQEYMAIGLPVVVPDYACNREIVIDGENGVLFEAFNAKSLADKIISLSVDYEKRKKLGDQARLYIEEKFSWENTWGAALNKVISIASLN